MYEVSLRKQLHQPLPTVHFVVFLHLSLVLVEMEVDTGWIYLLILEFAEVSSSESNSRHLKVLSSLNGKCNALIYLFQRTVCDIFFFDFVLGFYFLLNFFPSSSYFFFVLFDFLPLRFGCVEMDRNKNLKETFAQTQTSNEEENVLDDINRRGGKGAACFEDGRRRTS